MNPTVDTPADKRRLEKILFSADAVSGEQLEKFLAEITLIRGCPLPADVEPNACAGGGPGHDRR